MTIAKVNIEDSPGVPSRYGVRGIPTLIAIPRRPDGLDEGGRHAQAEILEWLERSRAAGLISPH
ncbi:MAG: hypothetical protein WDN45_16885 [Caulobacteraceae bacterium]